MKSIQEEDGGVCITSDGRVRQSSKVSKVGGRVYKKATRREK